MSGNAMLSPADQLKLRKGLPTLWAIWVGLFVSVLLYCFLAVVYGEQLRSNLVPDPSLLNKLIWLFILLSGVALSLAFYLYGRMLSAPSPKSVRPSADSAPHAALGRYVTTMLICQILCASISVYGFVLFLLGASFSQFYWFIGAAAISMVLFKPSFTVLRKLAETKTGKRLNRKS